VPVAGSQFHLALAQQGLGEKDGGTTQDNKMDHRHKARIG